MCYFNELARAFVCASIEELCIIFCTGYLHIPLLVELGASLSSLIIYVIFCHCWRCKPQTSRVKVQSEVTHLLTDIPHYILKALSRHFAFQNYRKGQNPDLFLQLHSVTEGTVYIYLLYKTEMTILF